MASPLENSDRAKRRQGGAVPGGRPWRRSLPVAAAAAASLFAAVPAGAQNAQPPVPQQPPKPQQTPDAPPPPATPQGGIQRDASTLPTPLTLAQAIEAALRLQPDVAGAAANREAAEARLQQSQASYYPRITPNYNYQYLYTFGSVRRIQDGGVVQELAAGQTRITRQGELSLNYTLFNSFQRELGNRQARQSLRSSEYSESNIQQAVIANVADAYFQALRTEALVSVSEAQVARARNTLDVVTAQVEAGVAARKDILQAQADYLNAQVTLLGARNNAEIAQAQLKNAIGVVGGTRLTLANVAVPSRDTRLTAAQEDGTPLPAPEAGVVDAERINQIAQYAFAVRPDVAQSRQNLEATQTGVRIARANAGLQVNANLNASLQYAPDDGNTRLLSLGLSYPLFDGGLVRSQVRQSQAQTRAAEATLTSLEQQVAVEVEQAYRNLAQARASLPAAEAAQAAAQVNYEAALEARREGVGSIVDVITAQTQLVQAQTNYIQAIYEFYAADARLARAVGQAERIGGPESPVNAAGPPLTLPAPVPPTTAPGTPPPATTPPPPPGEPASTPGRQ